MNFMKLGKEQATSLKEAAETTGNQTDSIEDLPENKADSLQNDISSQFHTAIDIQSPKTPQMIIKTAAALMLVAFLWAAFANLEEVARGEGQVIPSSQLQLVQAPENGNVSEILVGEGDIVEKGQVVAKIDETSFASRLGEIKQKRWTLLAKLRRLDAEINGSEPIFEEEILKNAKLAALTEKAFYKSRMLKISDEKSVLQKQLTQRQQERQELLAKQKKLSETVKLDDREMEIKKGLFERKVIPEIEFLQVRRQSIDLKGEFNITTSSINRVSASIGEVQQRLQTIESTHLATAYEELANTQAELAVLEETLKDANYRLKGTSLRSPVRGIVNNLHVATIGAVVQPGQNIMDIVPLDDTLLIEARIRPDNIAFLHPGLAAQVKVTAYDSTVYGSLEGKLKRIAADTTEDDNGNIFYKVIVQTDKNYLGTSDAPLPIIPGMITSVSILTGSKTVLEYILQPINRIKNEALRER